MKIIKRNGSEMPFDSGKIYSAISRANAQVEPADQIAPDVIQQITDQVTAYCCQLDRAPGVEEVQDQVEHELMVHGAFNLAKHYITYRYTRALVRQSNTTDDKILSLIECSNEEAKQENANKNPVINSTQRDYMAGEVSRDLTERLLLPEDIVKAHEEGIIHFHDMDYFAQHMHNCDLVNLEDMLQNGTVITGTLIEKPHSFSTACNIATQIIAQVASNQYGGQSISLAHLAPFVQVSREKIRRELDAELSEAHVSVEAAAQEKMVEHRLREEVKRGVQTIQYQVVTLLTTNGQAPFVTVYMYLGEAKSDQERDDLALVIEEVLRQRCEGVKNEQGVWVTPAFPKLIYVLEEDNIHKDSRYFYLTELAAKCTAKAIYKVNTKRNPLVLRSSLEAKYKKLGKYKKGKEVIVLEKTTDTLWEVVCPDGKRGYMPAASLAFVRNASQYADATGEIIEPRQLRDQPFRIYRVVPELDKVTAYARHIFYDLLENMVKTLTALDTTTGKTVVDQLSAACLSEHDFTFYSDLSTTAEEVSYENKNPVDILLGDGGIVEKYGGELQRDWFDVFMVERVGNDTNIQIRQGKNLTGIKYDLDMSDVVTRIMPTGQDKDGKVLYLPEVYVDSPNIANYPTPKWIHLAVSDCKEVTKGKTKKSKDKCYKQMREAAQAEFDKGCDQPAVTLTVEFIDVTQTEEYRQYSFLQSIFLGDAVRVIAKRVGVEVSMRMTAYTYNCLTRQYEKMTLGTVEDTVGASMISSRQLPSGIISGSKLALGSVGIGQLQEGSVGELQIQEAAIGNAHIQNAAISAANIQSAAIEFAHIAAATINSLNAGSIEAGAAKIASLTAHDIETDSLAAALAAFTVITCGAATFDAATIQHLVAHAMNLEYGAAGQVFIRNLAVEYAQMIGASIGNLCIKASDGNYYSIDVDSSGNVTGTLTTVTEQEIDAGQTESGRIILETSITASDINTTNLLGTFALINDIDAARIDVDQLFARQAFIDKLNTSIIQSQDFIELVVGKVDESVDEAMEDATPAVLHIDSSRGTVFKDNNVSTVLSVSVHYGKQIIENITTLRATFGASAHLQWEWLRMDEDRYGIISADDTRLSDGSFRLTLGPADVDVKVTFRCALITD